ncbi:hypothetical protein N0V88_004802 [Collariella sp. IMI 366227]|nr:hypothetical protein N0V88_004802 [Collariella sp. IMI 366227]
MLKEQLRPFIRDLGPDYQFSFMEGAIPCGSGPGVPNWASGPFYSYATGFTPSEVRDALGRLDAFIHENGSFDGVLGFSMGAAMAISYMLDHQRCNPNKRPPFSFAVLFSPIFIASPDDNCYAGLVNRLLDDEHAAFRANFPDSEAVALLNSDDERIFARYLSVVISMHATVGNVLPNTRLNLFAVDDSNGGDGKPGAVEIPRLLHPALFQERVAVPTVYITGEKDVEAMAEQSRVAREMCEASLVRMKTHDGGHDVPFKKSHVKIIVESIKAAAEEGRQLCAVFD